MTPQAAHDIMLVLGKAFDRATKITKNDESYESWIISHMKVYPEDINLLPKCQKDRLEILNLSVELK